MADSAEPKSIAELRDEHKVNVMAVDKYPGSVEHGVKYMQDLEEIIIDPVRCPLAATQFINYALQMNRQGEVISKYPDKDNDSVDCTRYLLSQQIKVDRIERRKSKFKARPMPVASRWGR